MIHISLKFVPNGTIATDNALAPSKRTNDGLLYWRIYVTLGLSEFNSEVAFNFCKDVIGALGINLKTQNFIVFKIYHWLHNQQRNQQSTRVKVKQVTGVLSNPLEFPSETFRLFAYPFVQAQIKENIKAPRHFFMIISMGLEQNIQLS